MIARNIQWDTDGDKEILQDLPTAMTVPDNLTDDGISDWLSDQTGFCHFGFTLEPDIITICDDGDLSMRIRIPADCSIPTITIGRKTYFKGQISYEELEKVMNYPGIGRNEAGYVSSVISAHISDIIDRDFEQFLDYISLEMCGSDCLSDVTYKIVGLDTTDPNTLLILVRGNVSVLLDVE